MTERLHDEHELLNITLKEIKHDLHEVRRAVVGAPLEGNLGLIQRMDKQEKRTSLLLWLSPFWIIAGTSMGTLLASWWGF